MPWASLPVQRACHSSRRRPAYLVRRSTRPGSRGEGLLQDRQLLLVAPPAAAIPRQQRDLAHPLLSSLLRPVL